MLHEKFNKVLTYLLLPGLLTLTSPFTRACFCRRLSHGLPQVELHLLLRTANSTLSGWRRAGIQLRLLQTHALYQSVVPDRSFHTTPLLPVRFPSIATQSLTPTVTNRDRSMLT